MTSKVWRSHKDQFKNLWKFQRNLISSWTIASYIHLRARARQVQLCMSLSPKISLSINSKVTRRVLWRSKSMTIRVKKLCQFIKNRSYLVPSWSKIEVRSRKNLSHNIQSKYQSKAQRKSRKDLMKANFHLRLARAKQPLLLMRLRSKIA